MSWKSKDEEKPRTGEVSGGDERTEEGDKEERERDGEMGDEELEERPAGGKSDGRKGEGAS